MPEKPLLHQEQGEARLNGERSRLIAAARSKAGKWLAAAMLALSAQGCATVSQALEGTHVRPDFLPLEDTQESSTTAAGGRPRAQRQGYSGAMVVATANELPEEFPDPQDLQLVDERANLLFDQDIEDERFLLTVENLGQNWMEELVPGRVYHGTDGRRYVYLTFSLLPGRDRDPGRRHLIAGMERAFKQPCRVYRRAERVVRHRNGTSDPVVHYLLRTSEPDMPEL